MALVEQYKKQVEDFAEKCLRPYLDLIGASTWRPPAMKELNDCVWQTVVLQPFEVMLLDSPLLQRLRFVRQLGVAHWTYPGAAHTRFEHSVGALHQIERLLESLRKKQPSANRAALRPVPEKAFVNLLRSAALCHDVGHGAMSHVVENAFSRLGTISDLSIELSDALRVEEAKLSEAAAYFLMGSPAFNELVESASRRTHHELPANPTDLMRAAILGRPIHNRYPVLQELINGPFDADKLDYITRDAHMSGVPIVTDIPRLVQKVRSVEVEKSRLPQPVLRHVTTEYPSYVLYGVALSGGRTLDELMFGRTLLFDKIYRHQKVRATEAMVASIIEHLVTVSGDQAPLLPLLFEDDELLDFTRDGLQEKFAREIATQEWEGLQPARDIAARVKRRQLFVRAFAFAQSMPLDPFRHDEEQRRGFERLLRESAKPEGRRTLIAEIVEVLRRMRSSHEGAWPAELEGALTAYVVLDAPDSFGHPKEISRAYLVNDEREVVPFREDSAESPAWSAAYLMTRDLGYVFAPRELAVSTFLAAEIVFRQRFAIRTARSAQNYAKIAAGDLDRLRRDLTSAGFYDDLPNDLRAAPTRLEAADVDGRIATIVKQLSTYEGIASESGAAHLRPVRVDAVRVYTWLRQFRTDEEVAAALEWLEKIRMISREDVHQAVRAFMASHPEFRGAWVCPFGNPKDSSFIVTYFVNDIAAEFELQPATLREALNEDDGKPILFVDDFIASGAQARTIMCNWMDDAGAPLKEDHGPALSSKLRAELTDRDLGFVFIVGDPNGVGQLLKEAERLGLKATAHAHISSADLPRATSVNGAATEPVIERARDIGTQLLESSQKEKTNEWRAERALGYGNDGYLLLFPYNTPTQTLTLLWAEGLVDGWQWLPLFPRRSKR